MKLEKSHILKERAEKLAKVNEKEKIKDGIEVLVFHLSQEQYALETFYIKEVYPYKKYTILPGVPAFISGLINIRRKVFSILDLNVFFSLPHDSSSHHKFIIVEDSEMEFAILTDGIVGIQKIPHDQIEPLPPTFSGIQQNFLKGITTDHIVILDGKKLISSKLIIVDETVEN